MENILLVFLNKLKDIEGFNKIIDEFDKRAYKMYLYDDIKCTDFEFAELPDIIEFYKNQHNGINKIVILSNLRDLIFTWYRCFNSIVDDFVCFIDEEDNNYFDFEDRHYGFYQSLFEFANINDEKIDSKIYTNINFNNYIRIMKYILKNNNFSFFASIDNFPYNEKTSKEIIVKEYIYKGYEYLFDFYCVNGIKQTIRLNEPVNFNITIDNSFITEVIDNLYIMPFLTIHFYKEKNNIFTGILRTLFQQLKNMDKENQAKVFTPLFNYLNIYCLDFKEKIYIASLLVMIHGGDERLTEFIMKTLLEDKEYKEFHYEILVNILFYISSEGVSLHEDYYLDQRNIINKLSKWIVKKEKFLSKANHKGSKHIAIVVDQLLSIKHSPTKLMLDYAKNIKKYYPEYEIKIFVEDNLYCTNKEGIIPYSYSSGISESCKEEHKGYLNNNEIKIYYSDINKSKEHITLDMIKEIDKFQPQAILTNSDVSLSINTLYSYFPIVYMSMGGDYFSNKAHIYLCGNREKVVQSNNKYNLLEKNRVYDFKYGLEFHNPTKIIKRKDFNIEENDFVMISVGNRLDAEMDEEFIDYVSNFITHNRNVKWILVGPKDIKYLEKKYNSIIGDNIIKIKYESDLPALYRICDVYVNPRRKGGGISIAMAMNEGLPIAITKDSTDGVIYTGIENASDDDMGDYIQYLSKIYFDKQYLNEKKEVSKQRIKEFEMEASVDFLVHKINNLN